MMLSEDNIIISKILIIRVVNVKYRLLCSKFVSRNARIGICYMNAMAFSDFLGLFLSLAGVDFICTKKSVSPHDN
jgi:hypothetical protein